MPINNITFKQIENFNTVKRYTLYADVDRFSLSPYDIKNGDIIVIAGTNLSYLVTDVTNLNNELGYSLLNPPSGAALAFRQGLAADLSSYLLEQGEPGWATDTKQLSVGDGTTLGGVPINPVTYNLSGYDFNNIITVAQRSPAATDTRTSGDKYTYPFVTLQAANTWSSEGDLIHVYPGTYSGFDLGKNLVNWYFEPNSYITPSGNINSSTLLSASLGGNRVFGGGVGTTYGVFGQACLHMEWNYLQAGNPAGYVSILSTSGGNVFFQFATGYGYNRTHNSSARGNIRFFYNSGVSSIPPYNVGQVVVGNTIILENLRPFGITNPKNYGTFQIALNFNGNQKICLNNLLSNSPIQTGLINTSGVRPQFYNSGNIDSNNLNVCGNQLLDIRNMGEARFYIYSGAKTVLKNNVMQRPTFILQNNAELYIESQCIKPYLPTLYGGPIATFASTVLNNSLLNITATDCYLDDVTISNNATGVFNVGTLSAKKISFSSGIGFINTNIFADYNTGINIYPINKFDILNNSKVYFNSNGYTPIGISDPITPNFISCSDNENVITLNGNFNLLPLSGEKNNALNIPFLNISGVNNKIYFDNVTLINSNLSSTGYNIETNSTPTIWVKSLASNLPINPNIIVSGNSILSIPTLY